MTRLVVIAAFLAMATLVVGFPGRSADRDYEASYRYMRQIARKQHRRADDLQRRLTVRVLEVYALRRQLRRARQAVAHRPDSLEAIRLASIAYRVDEGLLRSIASCETGGSMSRYAKNPSSSASGLFQFLTGTFARTPYGGESIWSPYASALAAGWMISRGRRGEWVC